jgi:hypothetical protein
LYFLGAFTLSALLWFIPQLSYVGIDHFFSIGWSFVGGHFSLWGNTLVASADMGQTVLSFSHSLLKIFSGQLDHGFLSILWFTLVGIGFIYFYRQKMGSRLNHFYLIATLAYLLWILCAQNSDNIRHFIPLIPAVLFVLIPLFNRFPPVMVFGIIFLVLMNTQNYTERKTSLPITAQLHHWLENAENKQDIVLYCGETERFFDRYPSQSSIISISNPNELGQFGSWLQHDTKFICDDIPEFSTLHGVAIVAFHSPKGDPEKKLLKIYPLDKNFTY